MQKLSLMKSRNTATLPLQSIAHPANSAAAFARRSPKLQRRTFIFCACRVYHRHVQENPALAQAGPLEPPPPYSSEAEALATQRDHVGIDSSSSSNKVGVGSDAVSSLPPYSSPLQPSPMSTAPRPSGAVETLDGGQLFTSPQQQDQAPQAGYAAAAAAVDAAIAEAARQWPPAAARKAAPARPPMEREDSVLKEALSRRKESLRRLEDVRAGARARLAALKAETDARRAAKLAAAGSGRGKGDDAAKAPQPPPPPPQVGGHSGEGPIPAAAGPGAPAPLPPASGGRVVGPAQGGETLPAGGPPQDGDDLDGKHRSERDHRREGAPEAATPVPAAADDGGLDGGGGGVAGGRLERPTNKRRQVPRKKEAIKKEKKKEKEEIDDGKEEEEAVVTEVPGGNRPEEQEKKSSVAVPAPPPVPPVPPAPPLPAEVKNVEGFKALWRETVKVRQAKGDVAAAAKEAIAGGEKESRRPSADGAGFTHERGGDDGGGGDGDVDVDDGEAEAGWIKIDLVGKEAGDEVCTRY